MGIFSSKEQDIAHAQKDVAYREQVLHELTTTVDRLEKAKSHAYKTYAEAMRGVQMVQGMGEEGSAKQVAIGVSDYIGTLEDRIKEYQGQQQDAQKKLVAARQALTQAISGR